MTPRHAIILAAGRGSRLGGLTAERPKCLVPVHGHPLLEWQQHALKSSGVTTIAVVRGYLADQLSRPGLVAFDNPHWSSTNMVRSLQCAAPWLRQHPCIVSYSDIVYLSPTVAALAACPADIALTFDVNWRSQWEARFADPLVDAETFSVDEAGRVVDIGRKPTRLDEINGQYMGLLKFTPVGWSFIESFLGSLTPAETDRLDMTGMLSRLIAKGVAIQGVPISDPWFEVDSQSDLEVCERALAAGGWAL